MAVWSSIKYSKIQGFNRADAEFYKPGYQEFFERVKSYDGERISNFAYITDGIHASPQIVEDGTRYISPTNRTNRTQELNWPRAM